MRWVAIFLCLAGLIGCSLLDRQGAPKILDLERDPAAGSPVGRGREVSLLLRTNDPDNDELDFQWTATGGRFVQSGRDTLIDLFQDSVTVKWQAPGQVGLYDLFVQVSDGQSKTKAKSGLQIQVTQSAPTANAGPDRVLAYSDTLQVRLDGSGSSDPDGDALHYFWNQIEGPGVALLPSAQDVSPIFRAIAPADYMFTLYVVDDVADTTGALSSPPDTVRVRVTDRGGR